MTPRRRFMLDDARKAGTEFRKVLRWLPPCLRRVYDTGRHPELYHLGKMARESLAARERGEPSPILTPADLSGVRWFLSRLERYADRCRKGERR